MITLLQVDTYNLGEHIGILIKVFGVLFGIATALVVAISGLFWRTFNKAQDARFKLIKITLDTSISGLKADLEALHTIVEEVRQQAFKTIEDNTADHKEFTKLLSKHDVVYEAWMREKGIKRTRTTDRDGDTI